MLQESKNEVFIEGILNECVIKEGTDKHGVPYLSAVAHIAVNQMINGVEQETVIPVRMYSGKTYVDKKTQQRKPNPGYEAIERIRDTYTSVASAGNVEDACAVRVSQGTLSENIFVPQGSDRVITGPQIDTRFLNKINKADMKPLTKFTEIFAVKAIFDEVDVNDDLTGALIVQGVIGRYGGKADIIDFKVYNENAIQHIRNYWKKGDTVKAEGKVNIFSKTEYTTPDEIGFGEAIPVPKTTTSKELIITSGSSGALEPELSFAKEDLNEALAARQSMIEDKKTAAANKSNAQSSTGANDSLGF